MAGEVGIRELRQNLSVYLRRVADGERFLVTDRRRPVAELGPIREDEEAHERWLGVNRLRPPTRSIQSLPSPIDAGAGNPLTRTLQQDREQQVPDGEPAAYVDSSALLKLIAVEHESTACEPPSRGGRAPYRASLPTSRP